MNNLIAVNLSPEAKAPVMEAISAAKLAMLFLIKLSDDDRRSLQMMDDGRKPFVEKCIDYAIRNESLNPGSGLLDLAPNDVSLFSFLSAVENDLKQLLEMVHDTKQVTGSEAYEVARIVYMKAKMNVMMGIPGSQAIVDEHSKLYKQNGHRQKQPMQNKQNNPSAAGCGGFFKYGQVFFIVRSVHVLTMHTEHSEPIFHRMAVIKHRHDETSNY